MYCFSCEIKETNEEKIRGCVFCAIFVWLGFPINNDCPMLVGRVRVSFGHIYTVDILTRTIFSPFLVTDGSGRRQSFVWRNKLGFSFSFSFVASIPYRLSDHGDDAILGHRAYCMFFIMQRISFKHIAILCDRKSSREQRGWKPTPCLLSDQMLQLLQFPWKWATEMWTPPRPGGARGRILELRWPVRRCPTLCVKWQNKIKPRSVSFINFSIHWIIIFYHEAVDEWGGGGGSQVKERVI